MDIINKNESKQNKQQSRGKNIESPQPNIKQNNDQIKPETLAKDTNPSDETYLVIDLNKNNLIQGFVMSEILGRPRAKRSRGNFLWNSRF